VKMMFSRFSISSSNVFFISLTYWQEYNPCSGMFRLHARQTCQRSCRRSPGNQLHASTSAFLRSWTLFSVTRNCQHSMEPGSSLPWSQQTATDPYPGPDESSSQPHITFL